MSLLLLLRYRSSVLVNPAIPGPNMVLSQRPLIVNLSAESAISSLSQTGHTTSLDTTATVTNLANKSASAILK